MTRGPVEFFHLDYTKADLKDVPEEEVVFFFMMAQMHNDTNALLRLVYTNWPDPELQEPVAVNRATTCFMAIRVLAGRLEEGWKVIKDRFNLTFSQYPASAKARASHAALRAYFGPPNLVRSLRNKAGYHFERDVMLEGFRAFPDDGAFRDFLSRGLGNTVYWGAEHVMTSTAILVVKEFQPALSNEECLTHLLAEVSRVAADFLNVTTAYCWAFYQKNLPAQLAAKESSRETVSDQPSELEKQGVEFLYSKADRIPDSPSRRPDLMMGASIAALSGLRVQDF